MTSNDIPPGDFRRSIVRAAENIASMAATIAQAVCLDRSPAMIVRAGKVISIEREMQRVLDEVQRNHGTPKAPLPAGEIHTAVNVNRDQLTP